jgi:hypothetical protein
MVEKDMVSVDRTLASSPREDICLGLDRCIGTSSAILRTCANCCLCHEGILGGCASDWTCFHPMKQTQHFLQPATI